MKSFKNTSIFQKYFTGSFRYYSRNLLRNVFDSFLKTSSLGSCGNFNREFSRNSLRKSTSFAAFAWQATIASATLILSTKSEFFFLRVVKNTTTRLRQGKKESQGLLKTFLQRFLQKFFQKFLQDFSKNYFVDNFGKTSKVFLEILKSFPEIFQ